MRDKWNLKTYYRALLFLSECVTYPGESIFSSTVSQKLTFAGKNYTRGSELFELIFLSFKYGVSNHVLSWKEPS